jgi:hypothetical protein
MRFRSYGRNVEIHSRRGLTSPVPRGERGVSRKAIAQGVPDVSALPDLLVCAFIFLHTRLRVRPAPGIPCALCLRGQRSGSSLGQNPAAGILWHACVLLAAHPSRRGPYLRRWRGPRCRRPARARAPQDEDGGSGVMLDPHGEEARSAVSNDEAPRRCSSDSVHNLFPSDCKTHYGARPIRTEWFMDHSIKSKA